MHRPFLLPLILASTMACNSTPSPDTEPAQGDLEAGLQDLGKADAFDSGVSVFGFGINLRGAVARALYNHMNDSDAPAITFRGFRLLRGPRTACITNGEATFCQLIGHSSMSESEDFEATIEGPAAGFVASLGFNAWFACTSGSCAIERSEVLTLEFEGLEDLGEDYVYEGWAVTGAFGAQTTDRFADPSGRIHQRVAASVAEEAITYVLTIEPRRGDESSPAATHVLANAIPTGELVALTTEHPAALATDFASVAGAYLLATPSSPGSANSQGIWFLDPATGAATLSLPTLPEGWVYEGWVVDGGGPVSTGRFLSANGADFDGGGPAAGPEATPPFPGQDFIEPAMDLLGATVVISVEPEPDNSPAPFSIKPLIDVVADDVAPPAIQTLERADANRAHGWAILGGNEIARVGEVWTADRVGGFVSVVDVATARPIANLVFGDVEPMYVNQSDRAGRVFVGDRRNNQVLVIDAETRSLERTIPVGAGVFHQWVNRDGKQLWVNNDIDNSSTVINVDSGEVIATVPMPADLIALGGKPHDVFVASDGSVAFVTIVGIEGDRDAVVRFDTSTFEETHRADVGKDPHVFMVPAHEAVLVASQDTSEVAFLDRWNLDLLTTTSVPGAHGITGADDGRVYVTNTPGGGLDALFAIDANDATVLSDDGVEAPMGDGNPHNVTINRAGTMLFVTHSGGNARTVSFYEVSKTSPLPILVGEVTVGRNPFGLGFVH